MSRHLSRVRTLPPVRSPIEFRALIAGGVAALTGTGSTDVRLLETLKTKYGARAGLLTDSGTSALRLALSAAAAADRLPVAMPAYSCYDLATAAIGAEARVLLYDLNPRTLEPDPESLARVLDAGARTLVAVHLFGQPAPVDRLLDVCSERGILLIEDAAQAAGGRIDGRRLGSFGSLTVLSFGRGKGLTGGAGGALLANDEQGVEVLESTAVAGTPRRGPRDLLTAGALWALARPSCFWLPRAMPGLKIGETVYRPPRAPSSMSLAATAIAVSNLCLVEAEREVRVGNAARLRAAVPDGDRIRVVTPDRAGSEPGWLRLPVLLEPGSRDLATTPDAGRLGIAGGYPAPLDLVEPLRPFLEEPDRSYPGADRLASGLFTLPTNGWLSDRDLERLEDWLRRPPMSGTRGAT